MNRREARSLRVHTIETGRFVLLHAAGSIDAVTTPVLSAALQPLRRRSQRLILDLREVEEIEGVGLALLVAVADDLEGAGGQLRVIAQPGSPVERTLELTRPDRRLPVFHSAPEALAGRSLRD